LQGHNQPCSPPHTLKEKTSPGRTQGKTQTLKSAPKVSILVGSDYRIIKHNMVKVNKELEILAKEVRKIFGYVYEKIRDKDISEKKLDSEVLTVLKNTEFSSRKTLKISFSEPKDEIYKAEAGRTPYDLLCYGEINKKEFKIFINNKFGNLFSNARNDITTYNNLIRLYLGISKQRLAEEIKIDRKLILKRVSNEEIISYGVFVVDNKKRGYNFFLLEEVRDEFYINPRNTMFQIKYSPSIGKPIEYYSFCIKLIDATIDSLEKNLNATKTEIIILGKIKETIMRIRKQWKR